MAGAASAPNVDIMLAGAEVPDSHFLSYTVNRDMFQPDHATIELSNEKDIHATHKIGDPVEIKVGSGGTKIFEGEITAIKAVYKGDGHTTVQIHALNKLARLARARKSVTYQKKTDQQILQQVVSAAGLSLEWKHETSITYDHVYQHNQTDLEFLRTRAARMGCHVWCVGTTVYVKQPDFGASLGLKFTADKAGGGGDPIRMFTPMIDSAGVVKKVTVRGWDPEKKQEIVGDYSIASSPLGPQNASAASGPLGKEETFVVDHPIWSVQEAKAIAKAHLIDLTLKYITGDVEISGNEKADIGKTVEIVASSTSEVPFNGKYYVMGLRHVHRVEKNKSAKAGEGGFVTTLHLARDGQKG